MAQLQIVILARNMASGALRDVSGDLRHLESSAGVASRGLTGVQDIARTGLTAAMVVGGAAVVAAGAGMVAAVDQAADFESQLNILTVAARSSGTTMEDLSSAALQVGSDSTLVGISASQAADAMTNFYRAGLNTTDVFGDLQGYLSGTVPLSGALRAAIDLAAASELDLAQASTVTTIAMSTFGLGAQDAATIANSFVGAADASVASVGGLADALVNVGPVAASMGMSLEDTNIALAMLSTRGIQGSEAGTALRSMLLHLQSGTTPVTEALDALNISLYDQQGNMLPLPTIIGNLQTAMSGLTQEQRNQYMQTLAGTYGLGAMNVLVGEGIAGWDEMATAVNSAATAQEVGAARTQGFNAAMEQLHGVIETLLIGVGTPLIQNFLTPGVQLLGEWLSSLGSLIPTTEGVNTGFQTLLGYGQQLLTWLGTTLGPIVDLVGQFVSWKDVVIVVGGIIGSVLIAGLAGIVSAAAPVIAAFAALVLAVSLVRTAWETDFGGIRTFVESVVTIISGILGGLVTYIQTHGQASVQWFTVAWQQIQTFVGSAVTALDAIIRGILGPIQSFLASHSAEITGFLIGAWQTIGSIVNGVLLILQSTIIPVLQAIADYISTHSAQIQAVLSAAWTIISSIVQGTLDTIQGIIRAVLAIIRGDWDGAWAALRGIVETQLNTVRTVIETIIGLIGPWIQARLADIQTAFSTAWQNIKTAVETKVAEIRTAIETWLNNTVTTITSFDLSGAARALFQKVIDGILSKVGEALVAVANFLDNAFLAIESFDLQAAAQTFFGTTIPGIVSKAGEAISKVGDWLSDVGDEIAEKDLQGQASSFFGTVIPGIQAKATAALTTVATWLSNAAVSISSFSLQAAALTLFGTIIPGIMQKVGEALTAVGTFLSNIADTIAAKTFQSETMTAIQTVIVGILAKVGEALTAIGRLLQGISNAISSFSLHDVGVALINGLIGGIQSMVGALVSAATGVVGSAIDAAKGLLGISSPSWVFRAMGIQSMQGLSLGFLDMATAVVNTIKQVLGSVTVQAAEDAQKIAEALSKIVDAMLVLVDGAASLAAFVVPDGMTAAIDEIVVQIEYVIGEFVAVAAQFEANALTAASDFADAASSVFGTFAPAIDAITALADYTFVRVGPAAETLVSQMQGLVFKLARIADELGPEALASAAEAGGLLKEALQPWADGVSTVAAIAEATLTPIGRAAETLVSQMKGLAYKLARIATELGPEAMASAATAGGLLTNMLSPWQAGIAVVTALAEYTSVPIGTAAEALVSQMQGLAYKLARVAGELGPEALASAAQAGTLLSSVLSPWQQGIETISAISSYTQTVIGPAAQNIVQQMLMLAGSLAMAYQEISGTALNNAVLLAQGFGEIGSNIVTAVTGLQALLAYTGGLTLQAIAMFANDIAILVNTIAIVAAEISAEGLAAAVAFSQGAGEVGSNIESAVNGISALLAYTGGLSIASITTFISDMSVMIGSLADASALFDGDGLTAAVAFAEAAGTVGSNMENGVTGLVALMAYAGGLTVAAVNAFVVDMSLTVSALAGAASQIAGEGLESAIAFATGAGAIGSNLSDAVDGLTAIQDYGGVPRTVMNAFLGDVIYAVGQVAGAAAQFTDDGLQQALLFSEAAEQIGGMLTSGYEGLVGETGIEPYLGVAHETIDLFVADMAYVVGAIAGAATQFTADGLTNANLMSDAMENAGSALKDGVSGLILPQGTAGVTISDYAGIAHGIFDLFVADMAYVVGIIQTASYNMSDSGIAHAAAFADAAGAVYDALAAGIDMFTGLNGNLGPSIAAAMQIINDAILLGMTAMTQNFGLIQDAAWTFGYQWVNHIMSGLNSRLPDLVALMAYIRGLFPSSPAKYGPWRRLPKGIDVGRAFGADVALGVQRSIADVEKSVARLRKSMLAEFTPAVSITSGSSFYTGTGTATTDPYTTSAQFTGHTTRPPIHVNISNNTFGNRDDIDYLLEELDRRLELQGALR